MFVLYNCIFKMTKRLISIHLLSTIQMVRSGRGRVVKALDSKSNGVSPRRFESCRPRNSFSTINLTKKLFLIISRIRSISSKKFLGVLVLKKKLEILGRNWYLYLVNLKMLGVLQHPRQQGP